MTTIIDNVKLDFSDVLFVPQRSTWNTPQHRADVNLHREYTFKHSNKKLSTVGIIAANMDVVGTFQMADALAQHNCWTALHKFYTVEQVIAFYNDRTDQDRTEYAFFSMGITDADFQKFAHVYQRCAPKLICIDVANGYTSKFIDYVKKVRSVVYTDAVIMAGNVVTPDMTIELLNAGADIVKIGIGSGSVCTTRKVTGVGYPQLSAVMECANAAHGQGGHICSDGGIVQIGDFAKAYGAGADFVMSGGIFAGHNQCDGELIYDDHNGTLIPTRMRFHGMSSKEAMIEHYGEKASYRAAEGKEVFVTYKGSVNNTIEEILGGIRSTCTYIGAKKIKDIPKCTTFVRCSRTHNTIYGD